MEERPPMDLQEDEIDFGKYFAILGKEWWKVALFSLAVGVATLLYMFTLPNIYQATAVITPSVDETKQNPALGALASFGINVGGPSRVEDLESLFNSKDLAVRVVKEYKLWPILLGDRYDPATGRIRSSGKSGLPGGVKEPKPLGDWDAIDALKGGLRVSVNKKANTITISFASTSADGSANVVRSILEAAKSRLQEETLERAIRNKKFIEEQIGRTVDALTRDRLYALYGQEVEREMMARNREQFGFRVVDSPRVPDRKSGPNRFKATAAATLLSSLVLCVFFAILGEKKKGKQFAIGGGGAVTEG